MRKLVSYLIVISLFLIFSGCSFRQDYEDRLSSWIGYPEEKLVAKWGVPTSFYELDGKRYLTYSSRENILWDGEQPNDAFVMNLHCTIIMVVKDGLVESWEYKGNNCY